MSNREFSLGFTTLNQETSIPELIFSKPIPTWLNGILVRNGPGQFEAGEQPLNHWFDGMAMLHRFSFSNGKASYANKFIKSQAYNFIAKHKRLGYEEFASEPKHSFFQRIKKMLKPEFTNPCVNVATIDGRFVALTETPTVMEFDINTLNTLGPFEFDGLLPRKGMMATAHPHYDAEKKEYINFITHFGKNNCYIFYRIAEGTRERKVIGTINTESPAYLHSFGLTRNYIILVEYPLVVNPLDLLFSKKPFIENYHWRPEKGSKITLLERNSGQVKNTYKTAPFFAFHHINAYEENDSICMDISAYNDPSIIDALYLNVLRGEINKPFVGTGELRRYCLSLNAESVSETVLSPHPIELPRINYQRYNMKNYRYVYGIGSDKLHPENFPDRLLKIDLHNKVAVIWQEPGCYPGEPVFVAHPDNKNEDDGIILSVVLNGNKNNSFLLILDAQSFQEISRAEVPHHIPFGFHGEFYSTDVL